MQLTLSTLLLGLSLGSLIYGPLSDQYGRKPVLAAGLAVYVIAAVMAALAQTLTTLVLWRFLQGLGASSGSVLARAIVLDRWRGEQASRVLSWMAIFTFMSPVVAPIVGGQIASFGSWQTIFAVHAAAGAVCLAVSLVALRGTVRDPASRLLQRIAAYGSILRDARALGYMACIGLGFVGVVPLITNSSFVFQGYFGLTPFEFGLCFSLIMLGGSVGAYLNSRIVARLGIGKLIGVGTLSMAIGGTSALVVDAARRRRARDLVAGRAVHVRRRLHVRELDGAHDEPVSRTHGRRVSRLRRQPISRGRARRGRLEPARGAVAIAARDDDSRRGLRLRCFVVGLAAQAAAVVVGTKLGARWTRHLP